MSVVNGIDRAGLQGFGIRASLVATCVTVDELHFGILVTGDMHAFDGCFLTWNTAAARQRWTLAFGSLALETIILCES